MQYIPSYTLLPVCLLTLALTALPVHADSSSAVSASSTSVGSSSVSIEKSSDSVSSRERVAQGRYTVTEMVALADRPDMVRVHLQAVQSTDAFFLLLPREAAQRGQLANGRTVTALDRPFGIAFATAGTPFFLVLDDHWYRELDSRPVVL